MSKNIYHVLVATLWLLSSSYFANAATYTAVLSGAWTAPATWGSLTNVPTAADIVVIPNTLTVTVGSTTAVASSVTVNSGGKLTVSNTDKLTIGGALSNAGAITLGTGSSLLVGGALTNTGSLAAGVGILTVTGTSNNSGTLSVTTGTYTATGTVTNSGTLTEGAGNILLGSSLANSGNMTVGATGKLTFNGSANSTILSSGGTYTITGTVVMNMGASTTLLDVQDAKFISGINSGGNYYFTFTKGTFKMDNNGTLDDSYNSGSTTALTIPYNVVLESDNGTMNLATKGTTNNVLLSGQLLMNGGTVDVETNQTSTQDFRYTVNGGTPQLYINSGTLNIGSGFNPKGAGDYIDFKMTGGTMAVTTLISSNYPTFQLQNVAGGKTNMSGGLIQIDQPGNGNYNDLDMGGSAISPYSVTGGTVQFGGSGFTYNNAANFWIAPYTTTNYPNLYDDALNSYSVMAQTAGAVNALSLYISPGTRFDASNISTLNITSSNGLYAFDNEGTFLTGTNTVKFSGGLSQLITSTTVSPVNFYNLTVANTSGNVVLGAATSVTNQLAFTSGELDASAYPLTITNGAKAITGVGNNSYVITGDGVTKTGYLAIKGLPAGTTTTFPVGTSSYYLPSTINPGANTGTAYSAYVYPGVTTNGKSNGTSMSAALLSDMVNATWNITQTAGSGSATLGLNWVSAGTALEGANFQTFGTNIGITQFSGGNWSTAGVNGSEIAHTASTSFSSFTQFSVAGSSIILPLVLADFTATPKGNTVALAWGAFPDGQPASFTIQHSTDGQSWSNIGVVGADVSATVETDYTYTDFSPVAGQNYYRLCIQDADGSSGYSPVRMVAFTATARLSVYPNPANGALTISFASPSGRPLTLRLVNSAGLMLQTKLIEAGMGTVTMSMGGYPAGVYYLEILDGGQLIQTTSVMVVH